MIDYRYLSAFLLTVEKGSFTAAASALGIAQSAVSRQIKLLERSVDAQLLIRSPKKIVLTPQGKSLFEQARVFDQWNRNQFSNAPTLRIGTLPGVLENWLISRLAKMSPDTLPSLEIDALPSHAILKGLECGDFDLGLLSQKADSELVTSKKLFDEKFTLISREKVNLEHLHEHRWIYPETGGTLKRVSRKESPRTLRISSISGVLRLVEAGLGVAILPDHMIGDSYRVLRFPLKDLKGGIYLSMPNYRKIPDFLGVFLKNLTDPT